MHTTKENFRRLAMAAIQQAVEDACGGDQGAAAWLLETGIDWLEMSGIEVEPAQIQRACSMTWSKLQKLAGNKKFYRTQHPRPLTRDPSLSHAPPCSRSPREKKGSGETSKAQAAFSWASLANDLDVRQGVSVLTCREKEEMRALRI
jgi:hypothetical protein